MATTQQQDDAYPYKYWGSMFQPNNAPSDMLRRLLRGLAASIADTLETHDSNDLTPKQMSAFYHAVGGDYDPLFKSTPHSSIAFIYKALACLHSLQPSVRDDSDVFTPPTVPALKPDGFVTWQAIQLLLGPQEHVPFIQKALQIFEIRDPFTGTLFPKTIPAECFPKEPNPDMLRWHHNVRDKLEREALQSPVAERPAGHALTEEDERPTSSNSLASQSTAEEKADAARFFGRPAFTKNFQKMQQGFRTSSQTVLNTAKQMTNPLSLWTPNQRSDSKDRTRRSVERGSSYEDRTGGRRKSLPEKAPSYEDRRYDSGSGERPDRRREPRARFADQSPGRGQAAPSSSYPPRSGDDARPDLASRRQRPRRHPSDESFSSVEDERRRPTRPYNSVRRHKSYDPPHSPRPYREEEYASPRFKDDRNAAQAPPLRRPEYRDDYESRRPSYNSRTPSGAPFDARPDARPHTHTGPDSRRWDSPHREAASQRPQSAYYGNLPPRPFAKRPGPGGRVSSKDRVTFADDNDNDGQATPVPGAYQDNGHHRRRASQPSPDVREYPRSSSGGRHPRFETAQAQPSPRANDYFSQRPEPMVDGYTGETTPAEYNGSRPAAPSSSSSSSYLQPQSSSFAGPLPQSFNSSRSPSYKHNAAPAPSLSPRYRTSPRASPPSHQRSSSTGGAAEPQPHDDESPNSRALVRSQPASPSSAAAAAAAAAHDANDDDMSEWWDEEDEEAAHNGGDGGTGSSTASNLTARPSNFASEEDGSAAREDDASVGGGGGGGGSGSSMSQQQQQQQQPPPRRGKRGPQPPLVKQVSAVGGVRGRSYPKEFSWR